MGSIKVEQVVKLTVRLEYEVDEENLVETKQANRNLVDDIKDRLSLNQFDADNESGYAKCSYILKSEVNMSNGDSDYIEDRNN